MRHNYEVAFLGATVQCESFEHATAIQTAEDIIVGANCRDFSPEQLDQLDRLDRLFQLVHILAHYGRHEAANALIDRAAIMLQGS